MRQRKAVVAKRVDPNSRDSSDKKTQTDEIRNLADAAGYDVVCEITQSRIEDPKYQFGEGKSDELSELVERKGAGNVIFDNQLSPQQKYNLEKKCPEGTEAIDRFTLILEIFGQQAKTKKAQLQVKLAKLRYELPRVQEKLRIERRKGKERQGKHGLGEQEDKQVRDIKDRIERTRKKLESISKTDQKRRERRRESGFELVALAGYTNAGKSTLMKRLADDLEVGNGEDLHPDLEGTAEVEDRLFKTLGTTTRSATLKGRDVLVTDTVGFIRDLPHWLIESFRSTLDEVYRADLVVLVVDASDPTDEIRRKVETCRDTLNEKLGDTPIVTALNKIDLVSDDELKEKREVGSKREPNVVEVSALEGHNIESLIELIDDELQDLKKEHLVLPVNDDSMSLVSWIHDTARVEDVTYRGDEVEIEFEGRPSVVERSRAKASSIKP
ncbi:MAG: GTPase HflX [Halobacteria archaeon]|nr:GTPase HflX [Halobacteria archaeon]